MAFRRKWRWFGKLVSDEGFTLSYGHRTVRYTDQKAAFSFGFEDGLLFPEPHQESSEPIELSSLEIDSVVDHVIRALRFEGHTVTFYQPESKEDRH